MITTLYANGDSWVAGNGIERDPKLLGSQKITYAQELAWPLRLAEKLNCSYINDAIGGGSNQRMVRRTLAFIDDWPAHRRSELLVVLGWTSSERGEEMVSYGNVSQWTRMNAWQDFRDQWAKGDSPFPKNVLSQLESYRLIKAMHLTHPFAAMEAYLNQVWMLSSVLDQLGIKFMFFNTIDVWAWDERADLARRFGSRLRAMQATRYLGMDKLESMSGWCKARSLPLSPCVHPMIDGHEEWANHLATEYTKIYHGRI